MIPNSFAQQFQQPSQFQRGTPGQPQPWGGQPLRAIDPNLQSPVTPAQPLAAGGLAAGGNPQYNPLLGAMPPQNAPEGMPGQPPTMMPPPYNPLAPGMPQAGSLPANMQANPNGYAQMMQRGMQNMPSQF